MNHDILDPQEGAELAEWWRQAFEHSTVSDADSANFPPPRADVLGAQRRSRCE